MVGEGHCGHPRVLQNVDGFAKGLRARKKKKKKGDEKCQGNTKSGEKFAGHRRSIKVANLWLLLPVLSKWNASGKGVFCWVHSGLKVERVLFKNVDYFCS